MRPVEGQLVRLESSLRALIRDEIRRCVQREVLRALDDDDIAERAHETADRLRRSR